MKFELKGPFRENVYNLMREAGYHFLRKDEQMGELSFARPPHGFPRFHLFVRIEGENLIFNLHLDQKTPIYKGAPAPAGEYGGEVVEKKQKELKKF